MPISFLLVLWATLSADLAAPPSLSAQSVWQVAAETTIDGSVSGSLGPGEKIYTASAGIFEVWEGQSERISKPSPKVVVLSQNGMWVLVVEGSSVALICTRLGENRAFEDVVRLATGYDGFSQEARERVDASVKLYYQQRDSLRASKEAEVERVMVTGPLLQGTISGVFSGFRRGREIRLSDGTVWMQTSAESSFDSAYEPRVLLYPSYSGMKMNIQGSTESILVQRIR